jgi:hypothetical protein
MLGCECLCDAYVHVSLWQSCTAFYFVLVQDFLSISCPADDPSNIDFALGRMSFSVRDVRDGLK